MADERTLAWDLWRLAEEAEKRGIRILIEAVSGEHYATSSSDSTTVYRVTGFSCTCKGFCRWQRCTHHSLLLAQLGWLPEIDDPDDDPDPASPGAAVTAEVTHLGDQDGSWGEVPAVAGAVVPLSRHAEGDEGEAQPAIALSPSAAPAPWEETTPPLAAPVIAPGPVPAQHEPPPPLTLVPREERVRAMTSSIEVALERLAEQLAAGHTAEFEDILRFYAKFHQYSWHNTVLIVRQCPEATRVAGMRRWNELGYRIRKGEKALWILAPVIRTELDAATGEELEHVVGFRPVAVFDASQLADLDAKPLPSPERRLPDDAQGLYAQVKARVEGQGIAVEERPLPAGVQGASLGGRILLRPGLDSRSRLLTLLHEVCHEVAHAGVGHEVKPRQWRELEAEATAFTVGTILGIESSFSADYLLSYQVTTEDLKASLGEIQRLVREVLAIVAPTQAGEEQEVPRVA